MSRPDARPVRRGPARTTGELLLGGDERGGLHIISLAREARVTPETLMFLGGWFVEVVGTNGTARYQIHGWDADDQLLSLRLVSYVHPDKGRIV